MEPSTLPVSEACFLPGSSLAITQFSKNRSQKAQQERAAEAAESHGIAQQK